MPATIAVLLHMQGWWNLSFSELCGWNKTWWTSWWWIERKHVQNAIISGISINWIKDKQGFCPSNMSWNPNKLSFIQWKSYGNMCQNNLQNLQVRQVGPKCTEKVATSCLEFLPSKLGKNLRSEENGCNYCKSVILKLIPICSMSGMYGNSIPTFTMEFLRHQM